MSVSVIFGRLCTQECLQNEQFTLFAAFSEQRKSALVYSEQFSLNIEYVQTVCERMNDAAMLHWFGEQVARLLPCLHETRLREVNVISQHFTKCDAVQ